MATYRVTFEVELPDSVTDDEAEEFIRFGVGDRGDMDMSNPLADTDLQSCYLLVSMVERA